MNNGFSEYIDFDEISRYLIQDEMCESGVEFPQEVQQIFGIYNSELPEVNFLDMLIDESFDYYPQVSVNLESQISSELLSGESTGDRDQILPLTQTTEEPTSICTESANGDRARRGRPRDNLNKTPDELTLLLKSFLLKELNKIEKAIQDEGEVDRRRDDKPRTKLIRLIKKVTDVFLKNLVSVGDYKHKNPQRIAESYKRALLGLIDSMLCFNHNNKLFRQLKSSFDSSHDETLVAFASMHFSKSKVLTLSESLQVSETYVKELLKNRDGTSVKKFKLQVQSNVCVGPILELVLALIGDREDFPISLDILHQLRDSVAQALD